MLNFSRCDRTINLSITYKKKKKTGYFFKINIRFEMN